MHRWAERRPEAVASVGLGEDGSRREQTFAELSREVTRLAEALVRLGVREGDRVAIFLPMSPEVPVASHACAHIGAVQVPIFSGFAAPAVAQRLQASEAKVAITTRASTRRGREVPMLEILEEARREAPSVEHVVVAPWDELVADSPGELPAAELDSEAPYLLTYTSGTTGTPKGVVHVQGGFLVSIAREVCYQADAGPDDRIHFVTDMGWIMGPVDRRRRARDGLDARLRRGRAGLAAGPALEADRVGAGVRARDLPHAHARADPARRAADRPLVAADDRHHRRAVEPRPVPLALRTRSAAGAARSSTAPAGPRSARASSRRRPRSRSRRARWAGPRSGWRWTSSTRTATRVRGEVGELVCRKPFPGMTRGFWRDPERYLDTYWRRFPGIWTHGDWASVDEDGYWFLHGRSDDTLNIAGKRIGPAELESAAVGHPSVAEAAAIGVPHDVKGEVAWIFCVVTPGTEADDALAAEVAAAVAGDLGKAFKPDRVIFVSALPKTRSAKIVRRAVRAQALGTDPGDLSSLENPESLEEIANAV